MHTSVLFIATAEIKLEILLCCWSCVAREEGMSFARRGKAWCGRFALHSHTLLGLEM